MVPKLEASNITCVVSSADNTRDIPEFTDFRQITSDCRPWPPGGQLQICQACGTIQRPATEDWYSTIKKIYDNYTLYHQADGAEQPVFDATSGTPVPRSAYALDWLSQQISLPPTGRVLDVGTGTGAMLRSFSTRFPAWQLEGYDQTDRSLACLQTIPGFKKFYTGRLEQIDGHCNVITMIHSLEHVTEPLDTLIKLHPLLADDGFLFVQVPDAQTNPYDLLVADHRCHFTRDSLTLLMARAGYRVKRIEADWVPKELILIASPGGDPAEAPIPLNGFDTANRIVEDHLGWLRHLLETLDLWRTDGKERPSLSSHPAIGLFGSSIASTWLLSHEADHIEFIVDEDPSRIGQTHMGRPILDPGQAPDGAAILMPMPASITGRIVSRLKHLPVNFIIPDTNPVGSGHNSPNGNIPSI